MYFSLRQFTSPGTFGPNNSGRSPYKPSGYTRQTHNTVAGTTDDWYEYVYIWDSSDWQTGVKYFQPDFLDNYSGQTGYWEIQGFVIHEVSELEELSSTTSTALSSLTTRVSTAEGTISGHTTSINANSADITTLENTVNHSTTGVAATSSALNALTSTVTTQGSSISTNASDITALETTVNHSTTGVAATSSALSTLNSTVSTQGNSIIANANSLSTLSTTVGGNTSSIATQATSINGLEAKYTVKVDTNGHVAGFGLASSNNDGTPSSAFIVRADKFAVIDPSDTSNSLTNSPSSDVVPFIISGGDTYIRSAMIENGSITNAKIANATIDDAKIANLDAGKIDSGTINTSRLNLDGSTITSVGGVVQIASLAVNTGHIANLAVDTVKIADQAVTIPVSDITVADQTLTQGGGFQTVQTITHVATGAPVEIAVGFRARSQSGSSGRLALFAIFRGSTQIFNSGNFYIPGVNGAVQSFLFSEEPSAGTYTYTLRVMPGALGSSNLLVSNAYLRTLETKK